MIDMYMKFINAKNDPNVLTNFNISVAVTKIHLGTLTVFIALLIAAVKSTFVLRVFMHLKFENKMFTIMVLAIIVLIGVVIFITLLDYLYR